LQKLQLDNNDHQKLQIMIYQISMIVNHKIMK